MSWYRTALVKPYGAKQDVVSIYLLLPTLVLLLCVCPLFPPTFISSKMEECNWIKSDSACRRTCCGCTVPSSRPEWTSGAAVCGLLGALEAGFWVGLTSSHVLLLTLYQVTVIHSFPLLLCRIHLPAPVWHEGHAITWSFDTSSHFQAKPNKCLICTALKAEMSDQLMVPLSARDTSHCSLCVSSP